MRNFRIRVISIEADEYFGIKLHQILTYWEKQNLSRRENTSSQLHNFPTCATMGQYFPPFLYVYRICTSPSLKDTHCFLFHKEQARLRPLALGLYLSMYHALAAAARQTHRRLENNRDERMDPTKTAVVLIEYQNDFTSPGGTLHEAVKPVMEKHADARQHEGNGGARTRARRDDRARADHVHARLPRAESETVRNSQGRGRQQVVPQGTWGAAIVDDLKPHPRDIVVEGKRGLGGFASTNLDFILRSRGITTIALGGFLTNCCVESTMRTGYEKGYDVVTLKDCTATVSEEEQRMAVEKNYPMFSKPMTHDEFLSSLKAARRSKQSRAATRPPEATARRDHGQAERSPAKRGRGRSARVVRRRPRVHRRDRTPWTSRLDCPRQGRRDGPICRIEVAEPWVAALDGIDAFEQIRFSIGCTSSRRDLVRQSPANDGETRGTFALRSPVRPNPIGTSLVTLVGRHGPTLQRQRPRLPRWDSAHRPQAGPLPVHAARPAPARRFRDGVSLA